MYRDTSSVDCAPYGCLCETGNKSDMEFLSFHIFQIKERGKTGRGALSNFI